jgi:hypothetical protein
MPKCVTLGCPSIVREKEIWENEIVHRFHIVEQSDYKEQVSSTKD